MVKLLTAINIGSMAFQHRVAVCGSRVTEVDFRPGLVDRRTTPGGLLLQPLETPGRTVMATFPVQREVRWRLMNNEVRDISGYTVAQLPWDDERPARGWRDRASYARDQLFDGVELVVPATSPSGIPVLEATQALIDVFGAELVGVQIAPFETAPRQLEDTVPRGYCDLLAELNDMEIAYAHIACATRPRSGDVLATPAGQSIRAAFPGIIVASGAFTPETAIAAVERRWADLVGFRLEVGQGGADLLAGVRGEVA